MVKLAEKHPDGMQFGDNRRLARRDLVWINVTPHPTAEWVARQITEAFP
ncbi:MAG: hypothetical protein ACREDW_04745 [Aestuariivirgaceae bacterium]